MKFSIKKKIGLSIIAIIVLFAIVFLSAFIFPQLHFILPYETIRDWLLFDHIEYNGVAYYIADDLPDDVYGDPTRVVYITLVDANGKPYDEDKKEAVWLCHNDEDEVYLCCENVLYCYYTRDKAHAIPPHCEQ